MKLKYQKWFNRALSVTAALLVTVILGGCIYSWNAQRRLAREIAFTPRDPQTKIILGAESLDLGSGPDAVLLIHGFVGSPRDFGELPHALSAEGFHVVAPLLPGHGRYPTDLAAETADTLYAFVRERYLELCADHRSVSLVGFSMGGALAFRLATDKELPAPAAVVLANPYFGITHKWFYGLSPETWYKLLNNGLPYVVKGKVFTLVNRPEGKDDPISYEVVPTVAVRRILLRLRDQINATQGTLACRSLWVCTKKDGAASPKMTRRQADALKIPQGNRRIYEKSDHLIFHDYDRDAAIKDVVDFLLSSRSNDPALPPMEHER